ncbi:MAG TPA: hypothetical protein VN038_13590 [Dyadobacter sp.]|nr:hypothetical protein [Dyadobacter sp.]
MKTSEDKLNEALRDVLKRKFDDYEEQPNANALERIRARVKPARTGRYWWFTGALVLFSVSGILLSRFVGESKTSVSEKAVARAAKETVPAASGVAKPAERAPTVSKAPVHSARSLSRKTIWKIPVSRSEKLVKSVLVKDLGNQPVSKVHSGQAGNAQGATVSRREDLPPVNAGLATATAQGADPVLDNINPALAEEVPALVDSAMAATPLEELASMSLKEMQIPLHLRGVVAPAFKPAKVIVTNPTRVAWLFNASALHSYQILTVPSSAAQDFQNFSFPTLFTARSMGYKVSGGVERNGIQLQLHYSGFRQTYSYEIANNNYLVKPDDKGQYETVRQGDRVEENRKFSMLGIGVSRQLRWGHSPVSRFYAAFGAEYSHDLKSSQSLGWVSLGLGKQFAVSRHTAFSIGPYAEFSPVKVKGTQNPFYYQPYRVGISAGLRFVRP